MPETCANCGMMIGNLETPYLFRERVVCATCFRKLEAPAFDDIAASVASEMSETRSEVARRMASTVSQPAPVVNRPSQSGMIMQFVGAVAAIIGIAVSTLAFKRPEDFGTPVAVIGMFSLIGGMLLFGIGRFVDSQLRR